MNDSRGEGVSPTRFEHRREHGTRKEPRHRSQTVCASKLGRSGSSGLRRDGMRFVTPRRRDGRHDNSICRRNLPGHGHSARRAISPSRSSSPTLPSTASGVVDHGETERIAAPAFEKIPEIIVASQSLAVDAVTGATLSSLALLSAVEDCARQADGDVSALKRAEVPKEQPTDEEIECDLAVIGAGISGMASALAAAQQGAKVVVFEKSSSMAATPS